MAFDATVQGVFDPVAYVHLEHVPTCVIGLTDETYSLDDKSSGGITRTAAPNEAPQFLNPWVRRRQVVSAQLSAPLAVATNLAKASASRTAMSARILRSTSTPAAFRPAMKRL